MPTGNNVAMGSLVSRISKSGSSLDVASRVLRSEAAALAAMADALDEQFSRVVELIVQSAGKVVVTGMGKSGHVARKIASTLASTGTMAMFIHPAEASHGDLGMIAASDLVIALSNSGDTPELAAIITYSRRFSIPLVGMTSRAVSTLAEQADHLLLLPPIPEACPHGLAPTTSTTMMMALGDALAIALLEMRGFSANDFGLLHPGGLLGRALLRVGDVMHRGQHLPLVTAQTEMGDAILVMSAKRLGCVGITDQKGCLIGIVTDGDLRRHMASNLLNRSVADIMTRDPQTIPSTALVAEAVRLMAEMAVNSLFVIDTENQPIGILHSHDCMRVGAV